LSEKELLALIREKNIARVVHFAPFRNFHPILRSGAVLSAQQLAKRFPENFNPTDEMRLDHRRDLISMSIAYPNLYYMERAQERFKPFVGWALLTFDPGIMLRGGTEFCTRNAAAIDKQLSPGPEGLAAMYAQEVRGAYGNTYRRSNAHPKFLPTDLQAEVMLKDEIPLDYLRSVILPSEKEAKRLVSAMRILGEQLAVPLVVSAGCFDKEWIAAVRNGAELPEERPFLDA
jgi:hypothetical protein